MKKYAGVTILKKVKKKTDLKLSFDFLHSFNVSIVIKTRTCTEWNEFRRNKFSELRVLAEAEAEAASMEDSAGTVDLC